MTIRERINEGKSVRVQPLAEEVGMSASGLYTLISRGHVEAVKVGRTVLIPAHAARALLGLPALETRSAA